VPEFQLPYGKSQLSVTLPDSFHTTLLAPAEIAAAADPAEAVRRALAEPVAGPTLAGLAGVKSVAIAINDKTRPVPHAHLLPPLLEQVEALGLSPQAITLLIASGTHPPMPPAEFAQVVPADILARYPVICHDALDQASLLYLGQTRRGTPLWLNRHFVEADLRLVVGNLEPHQFMGFSGGVKSAVIGLAGLATINHNHSLMADPAASLGNYETNPARQDVEEMGRMVGVHFALNAILNDHKQLVTALAGEPQAVMVQGIPQVRQLYQVAVAEPFDLMLASPGGHPKDINMYQAQKGLAHAALVTKTGGSIILAAACPEGSGSAKYEQWLAGMTSHEAVMARFAQEGFRVGPHKAFQYARDATRLRLLFLSDLPPDFMKAMLLTPVASLAEGVALALADLPPTARIGVMPQANATIPTRQQYVEQAL
jgi:nickel-dependent lactate racemase